MNKLMKVAKVGFAIYGAYCAACGLWFRFGLGKEAWQEAKAATEGVINDHI